MDWKHEETPAHHVITKCGGHEVVAGWLGVHVSRVYRFTYPKERGGTGGVIPANHQPTLLQKASAEGRDLSPADFFSSHSAPTPTPHRESAGAMRGRS